MRGLAQGDEVPAPQRNCLNTLFIFSAKLVAAESGATQQRHRMHAEAKGAITVPLPDSRRRSEHWRR